jgi:hypothetical protein
MRTEGTVDSMGELIELLLVFALVVLQRTDGRVWSWPHLDEDHQLFTDSESVMDEGSSHLLRDQGSLISFRQRAALSALLSCFRCREL